MGNATREYGKITLPKNFRSSPGTYGLEPLCREYPNKKTNASDDILTQSFGMERSYGVCRSDIRPSHRRVRSPRIEGYFVGNLDTCRVWRRRVTHSVLMYHSKGAYPQIQLSMKTPRTGGAFHRWSVPITSETHANISVESKRLPHCFLPIMDASPSVKWL